MSKLRLNLNITTLLQKYKSLEAGAYNKKLDSKTDIHFFKIGRCFERKNVGSKYFSLMREKRTRLHCVHLALHESSNLSVPLLQLFGK